MKSLELVCFSFQEILTLVLPQKVFEFSDEIKAPDSSLSHCVWVHDTIDDTKNEKISMRTGKQDCSVLMKSFLPKVYLDFYSRLCSS